MDVFERVKGVIVDQIGCEGEDVTSEETLENLGVDDIIRVELTMALEEEFDLEISDETVQGFNTVGDVVNYITANT
jgi:acyl carrier protein